MSRAAILYKLISFPIDCEFHAGKGFSVFHPTFSQSTQFTATPNQSDGCEAPGCYVDHVTYSHGLKFLTEQVLISVYLAGDL